MTPHTPMSEGSIAELVDVSKRYPGETDEALAGISLQIRAGELHSITGESGAGKTTLLNLLGCLDIPTRGQYFLAGRPVEKLGEDDLAALRVRYVGFVFQHYHLIEHLTVWQNMEVRFLYGDEPAPSDFEARIGATLDLLGIAVLAKKHPRHLSGGEKQRVAIARTVVKRPLLLLADEPTGNLDEAHTATVFGLLERIAAEGTAVVVATHSAQLASRAQHRLRLRQGKLIDAT